MSRNVLLVSIHLLSCLVFLALPYLLAEDGVAKLAELPVNSHEQRNLMSYLLTIAFFYVNYYLLIPRLYFSRKYVLYGVCMVGCFLLIDQTLREIIRRSGEPPPVFSPPLMRARPPFPDGSRPPMPPDGARRGGPKQPGLPSEMSQTFFLFSAGLLLSLAIRINNRWQQTEQERLHTELSYLKAQINPHFLFNTLNSIYSLAIEQSVHTANAIVQLSSFLRYVIAESREDRVALSEELAYIGHYVALQKLRVDESVPIQYTTEGTPNGLQIAPLVLISFIENGFKYGVSPQEPSRIDIAIRVTGHELQCHVFNQKVRVFAPTAVASGIGLTNTKARLQLLYPGRHQLTIRDQSDSFTVDLSLDLS
jgi:hypothetical protein